MLSESRIGIYNYLRSLFYDVVTTNYYDMEEPEELTESDTSNGFVTVSVGGLNDESEFNGNAYAWARCYIYAFVPKLNRGRLNKAVYTAFEDGINEVIQNVVSGEQNGEYAILADSIISADGLEDSQRGNQFHVFAKSFIVTTNSE